MGPESVKLEDLVNMDNPQAVFSEVGLIVRVMFPNGDYSPLLKVCLDIRSLFEGNYPGYRKCNIHYHDLKHTTDCLLAMARLIHGALLAGLRLTEKQAVLGLVSSLLHDTGYIQEAKETKGTGAQYTLTHVERSIFFAERYLRENGYSSRDARFCHRCLRCTGLDVKIAEIPFESMEHEFLGKALGSADLLGQMADRTYLERLPLLFHEFREGGVPGFADELDLIKKTPEFWEFTKNRFRTQLGGVDRYMINHFKSRWGIDRDCYKEAIENNMRYLTHVIEHHESDYRAHLRRGNRAKSMALLEDG
ncbi:hypothetical protein [Syntrophobacter fumaroxidans]|uniref:HD/PDEase domain-containing protein n=1 Tax=Syntrophobacter fumaroxidans (strain DSM 10017 / MPOB) TaxID=335543 RepID=A0LHX4_SYNFM|nr:hypothetical protein [Syntrophobacter fumaroxidans]ABK17026.1 hypothetical protein Sfum_1335 [Syntrophobacter fumaroxidans MPOB]